STARDWRSKCLRGERRAERAEGLAMLRERGSQRASFERHQALKAVKSESSIHEGCCPWPRVGVHREARKSGIAEECGDRDVGNRNFTKEKPFGRKLILQIGEDRRDLLVESF